MENNKKDYSTVKQINIKNEILNKEFSLEYKGYNILEVDQFLDWLSLYFELLEKDQIKLKQDLKQLKQEAENYKKMVSKLNNENNLLKQQKKALEDKGVENVDIITRLSKLESIVNE